MVTVEEFAAKDLAKAVAGKSLIAREAVRVWREVLEKCLGGHFESRAMAVIYCCIGEKQAARVSPEHRSPEFAREQVSTHLYESMVRHAKKLEADPHWREVARAGAPAERFEALRRFMAKCVDLWRNDCIEVWRKVPGTFAYTHRRVQKSLRENLPKNGWRLYDPKSQFYGPADLGEPLARIDEKRGEVLRAVELPDFHPIYTRVFYAEPLFRMAKWLYEWIVRARAQATCALATRNYAKWLCFKYPELTPVEYAMDDGLPEDVVAARNFEYMEQEISATARKAAASLSPVQRRILAMTLDGATAAVMASEIGLTDSEVCRQRSAARRLIRGICLEVPDLSGASDPDNRDAGENSETAQHLFLEFLAQYCR